VYIWDAVKFAKSLIIRDQTFGWGRLANTSIGYPDNFASGLDTRPDVLSTLKQIFLCVSIVAMCSLQNGAS
jgi:hypothetical protein